MDWDSIIKKIAKMDWDSINIKLIEKIAFFVIFYALATFAFKWKRCPVCGAKMKIYRRAGGNYYCPKCWHGLT